jgi:hypothetical protein
MVNTDMPHHPAIIEGRKTVEGRDPRHESPKGGAVMKPVFLVLAITVLSIASAHGQPRPGVTVLWWTVGNLHNRRAGLVVHFPEETILGRNPAEAGFKRIELALLSRASFVA